MIYVMKNIETGEVAEYTMRLSEYDDFLEKNPHLQRYHTPTNMPGLGDTTRMSVPGYGQPHAAFESGIIQRIRDTVPGNTLAKSHKHKAVREW